MTFPTDEEIFDERVSPENVRDDHLNLIQAFLKFSFQSLDTEYLSSFGLPLSLKEQ